MGTNNRGAYLTFDAASQGTLFVHWSETEVEGALAFISPQKSVPAFKFKNAGGRSELIREMSGGTGERIKRYFSGWASFVKLAKTFQGTIEIRGFGSLPQVDVYLLDGTKSEDNVFALKGPTSLQPYVAVGVVPHPNPCYGATTMSPAFFNSVGNQEGVALTF